MKMNKFKSFFTNMKVVKSPHENLYAIRKGWLFPYWYKFLEDNTNWINVSSWHFSQCFDTNKELLESIMQDILNDKYDLKPLPYPYKYISEQILEESK